jgi:hypothetical protein
MEWRWRNPHAAKGHRPNSTRRVGEGIRKRGRLRKRDGDPGEGEGE